MTLEDPKIPDQFSADLLRAGRSSFIIKEGYSTNLNVSLMHRRIIITLYFKSSSPRKQSGKKLVLISSEASKLVWY